MQRVLFLSSLSTFLLLVSVSLFPITGAVDLTFCVISTCVSFRVSLLLVKALWVTLVFEISCSNKAKVSSILTHF